MSKKLLVIASDHVSAWIEKGEVVDRYYNPGNLFDEIHLLLINNDNPKINQLQRMAGNAKVFVHNYPEPPHFFTKTLGWQSFLIKKWVRKGVSLIKEINPNLIRSHGAHLNSYIASEARRNLGIPYVVSLHINPNENYRKSSITFKDIIISHSLKKIEKTGLRNADMVLPVYEPIVPYLEDMGVEKFKVCYNVLNSKNLIPKKNYQISKPINIVSIGRQVPQKNPHNLISALKYFDDIKLTLIGNGDLHEILKDHAKKEGVENKVEFVATIDNDVLCSLLHNFDFLAIHTEHFEISKVMLESFLVGLPVLLNYRDGDQVPELNDRICLRVKNSVEGYRNGILELITKQHFREELGSHSSQTANQKWSPEKCELEYLRVYEGLLK